jgi:hypothetical protein
MTDNPYPKMIDCDDSGQSVGNPLWGAWNQGWAAGYNDHDARVKALKSPHKNGDKPDKKLT